jgi:glutaredoxin 3
VGEWIKKLIEQQRKKMKAIVWSKYHCPYCDQAKALLTQKGIEFEERKIDDGYTKEDLLEAVPTARTVPQIFIGETYIGGFTELKKYFEKETHVN